MRKLRGRFEELMRPECATQDYVQITLTDEDDVPDAVSKLTGNYPNFMQLLYDNARTRAGQAEFDARDAVTRTPLELFEALYCAQNGVEMTARQRTLLTGMMETIWEEDA